MPSPSWSLRARVAVAFLVTTALAMLALGLFVQWRVQDTLEEGLRDQLETEMDRLLAVPPAERTRAVAGLAGEIHGQLLSGDGSVVATSPSIRGRMVDPAGARAGYAEAHVLVLDDLEVGSDDGAAADLNTEDELSIVLVQEVGDQVLAVSIGREDADDAVRAVRAQLALSGPVALLLAGGLGYLVAGFGLRPIERMRAHAATISSRNAGERLPVPPTTELRRLALTLNAMLDRLDDGLARERRFAADASHELRTPLALLLTEVELALAAPRSQQELLDALRSAEHEVRRLITLSEDLLALAGADAGHLQVHAEVVDLAELAADVVRRFGPIAAAANRSVSMTGDEVVLVNGGPDHLRRIVSNLVDNALRHGAGDVEVHVSGGPDAVAEVSDSGAGFHEERPFERFAASHGSVGLGLPIVDEIVRAHGGEIAILREHERTVVRVTLPR
ncbi:two-component sensor histidine kinase [Nocardioides psychrotolerans]|uniref:histidine kinase n=1 Tax=Nocardioides psychrotolerans TaxID=1005945 RepID=A0A1I3PBH9_9ACTN|nr:ATP-binding protein [Nocardioides psychrotolerans]GEP39636.1 two-component sensor histidine kinase [Nocardioides psychrotolerans]SFJ18779.1 Signal transduction histidine kinase [Nocardioides psychrotolerans]